MPLSSIDVEGGDNAALTTAGEGREVIEAALPPPASRAAQSAADRAWPFAVAALLVLQAALVLGHQPWVDEWQALQIAVQSPTLADLFANLRYEGHPPLWYLVLRAARGVLPALWTLAVVQLIIALAMQAILLLSAPFRRPERLLLACGAFALFEWGTIARDLSLGVLLALASTAARDRRLAWLATALLPLTGLQSGMLSLMLLVLHLHDRRWWWPGAALWATCALGAAWSVIPEPDMIAPMGMLPPAEAAGQVLTRLGFLLLPLSMPDGRWMWNGTLPPAIAMPCGVAFVWLSLRLVARDRLHLALYAALLAATIAFATIVYPLAPRHLTQLVLALILLAWRDAEAGRPLGRGARIWLAVQATCGLAVAATNLVMPFDTAAQAARTIRALGLEHAHWLAYPASHGQGVAAILGREFDTLPRGCSQSFLRWNMPPGGRLGPALAAMTRNGRVYLLSANAVPLRGVREIALVPAGWDGAAYHLSVAGSGPASPLPPPCAPARRPL